MYGGTRCIHASMHDHLHTYMYVQDDAQNHLSLVQLLFVLVRCTPWKLQERRAGMNSYNTRRCASTMYKYLVLATSYMCKSMRDKYEEVRYTDRARVSGLAYVMQGTLQGHGVGT